ncbi:Ig-like domain-containing protein [Neobacillus sp. 179-J 1A1 HS]|uniref:Ig-like domain-containing protein n=1 Tax=Neobacillus driksii TaxID=3035913 RepID=UPI0035BBA5AA
MGKRTKIISIACLLLALPSGALAEGNQELNPQSIKVQNGSQLLSAVDSTSIAALADDFFGPVLESATVSPTTVTVGETITITAKVSDDVSGVAVVNAYLNLPSASGYKMIPLELDTRTGEWKGTYTITDLDLEGTWIVNFDLFDNAGNYSFGDDMDDTIQVVNPSGGDSEFPTLESATLSSPAVGVNEEFTITAKVNDNNGVESVYAAVYTADSTGYYYLPLTYNEASGEWVVSHTFNEGDQSAPWFIDIEMFDKAGNFDWVTIEDEISLTNPFSDFTAPSIGEPVFSTTSASPGESVKVSVPVSDTQSNVSSVYAEFSHIDNPNHFYLQHLTLDQATGEWVGNLEIGSGFQSGIWNLVIHSTDSVGNSGFKEIFGAFDVVNNDGDFDAPVISNVQVTQGDVQVGDTVTVTANVTDNVAVDSVLATLYSQEGSNEYITMSYDEVSQLWTGSFVVQETTAPGFYQVSISTYDTSFNLHFADAAGGFTVVSHEGDYTKPVVSDVVFDKTEVNAGEQITVSATVLDAESGVASVTANYYENETIDLTHDSNQDKWVGTITVPTNVPDGEVVNINFIDAVDQSGNQTVLFMDGVSFLVHNPDGDFTAPVMESFVMTPAILKPGETVHFEAKLVDDKSGVKSAVVDLFNVSNPKITSIDLTYDEVKDVWAADYVIPDNVVLGSYSVSLEVGDNAGNIANNLQTQTLRVVDKNADITAPDAPTVSEVSDQSTEVSGTVEAGANVTVTIGLETYTGTADDTGNFIITIPAQTAGTVITVSAKDDSDNVSEETTVTVVDKTAPALPVVAEVNDQSTALSGSTEAGASVRVSIGSETYLGTADESGNFTISIPVQIAGTVLTVRAIDGIGNVSQATTLTVVDKTPPAAPIVDAITDKTTSVIGTTEADAEVTVKVGDSVIGRGKADGEGKFSITIPAQTVGTTITVIAKDVAGNESTTALEIALNYQTRKIQLDGIDFAQGYIANTHTHLNWKALDVLKIPYIGKGNGVFEIEGRTVQALSINGDWYIAWHEISPGRIVYERISGGYNFIYTNPLKVRLNGNDFAQGGYIYKNGAYVNWNALKILNIPYTDKGNGLFEIEGRNVQAVLINKDWYIPYSLLSPGKIIYERFSGGYNFIYTTPVRIQLNGNDFTQGGYRINNGTYVNWNALKILNTPYIDKGKGLFEVESRNVQAVLVNGDWYIPYSYLSSGIIYERISGGYNLIITLPIKVQLNGNDFAQGGYRINNGAYVNWNALKALNIPYTDKGKGLFEIEGRNVQAVSVKGDWYIPYSKLSPGKITYQRINGGYNFIYNQ